MESSSPCPTVLLDSACYSESYECPLCSVKMPEGDKQMHEFFYCRVLLDLDKPGNFAPVTNFDFSKTSQERSEKDAVNSVMPQESQTLTSEREPMEVIEESISTAAADLQREANRPTTPVIFGFDDSPVASRLLIFAVQFKEKLLPLEVPDSETVAAIKAALHTKLGVPPCRQELCGWTQNHITDDTILSSLHLPQRTKLYLHAPDHLNITSNSSEGPCYGDSLNCTYKLHIIDTTSHKEYDLRFPGSKTVLEVKLGILDLTNIPVRFQHWVGWPDVLKDENTKLAALDNPNQPLELILSREEIAKPKKVSSELSVTGSERKHEYETPEPTKSSGEFKTVEYPSYLEAQRVDRMESNLRNSPLPSLRLSCASYPLRARRARCPRRVSFSLPVSESYECHYCFEKIPESSKQDHESFYCRVLLDLNKSVRMMAFLKTSEKRIKRVSSDWNVRVSEKKHEYKSPKSSSKFKTVENPSYLADSEVLQNYKDLLLSGEDHDLIMKVKEREFKVHCLIMKCRCPVFKSMLAHEMSEKNSGVLEIPDCDPCAFEQFLLYIYTGKFETTDVSVVLGLYYIANKYNLDNLKNNCRDFIKKSFSTYIVIDIIKLALNHHDQSLLESATKYFVDNTKQILVTVEWQSFIKENPMLANDLFLKTIDNCSCHLSKVKA